MIAVDRLEKYWARGRRYEHLDCRTCNEPSWLCECHRPRRARHYDELDCLARMYRQACGRLELQLEFQHEPSPDWVSTPKPEPWLKNGMTGYQRRGSPGYEYHKTASERERAGWLRLSPELDRSARGLGHQLLRGLGLSAEAVYSVLFRERLHPEDAALIDDWARARMLRGEIPRGSFSRSCGS